MNSQIVRGLLGGFLRQHWVSLAVLIVLGAQHLMIQQQSREITRLHQENQNALLHPTIITQTREIIRPGDTKIIQVRVPGETQVVKVTVEKLVPVEGPPRIVTVSPPVFCATKEACDVIYAHSEQVITAQAHVKAGTVIPVIVGTDVKRYPLASDFPVHLTLAMVERGVFSGVAEPDNPLQPDTVTTSTEFHEPTPVARDAWTIRGGGGVSSLTQQSTWRVQVEYDFRDSPFFVQVTGSIPMGAGALTGIAGDVFGGVFARF